MSFIIKIFKKCKMFLINMLVDGFEDRKNIIINLYKNIFFLVDNILNKVKKINKIRKKKYSLKYIKYYIIMSLYILPKNRIEIYLEEKFEDFDYLKLWAPLYFNFAKFKIDTFNKIKDDIKKSRKKKRKKFVNTLKVRKKIRKVLKKLKIYNRELFNYVYSYYVYQSVYAYILVFITVIITFIFCYEYFDSEVYY